MNEREVRRGIEIPIAPQLPLPLRRVRYLNGKSNNRRADKDVKGWTPSEMVGIGTFYPF